jgi:transketolase
MNAFAEENPDRFIQMGIAEANMIGVATGLAIGGKVPFTGTFAGFATGSVYDQIRQSVAYSNKNVKVCASHAGVTLGEDGATHQCNEDFGLMRMIPGMVVICPSDEIEARAAVRAAMEYVGPVYLRFGRAGVPVFNIKKDYKFEIGKGIVLKDGTDLTFISNGFCLYEALQAAQELSKEGLDVAVINMHTIKPLDEDLIIKYAEKTKKIVTIEEHSIIGGLGSAVCECLSEKRPTKILRIGINDVFGESGPALELVHKYELDAEGIVRKVKEFLCK